MSEVWLPQELRGELERFRRRNRRADPTEGFARRLASHHPAFDKDEWAKRSPTARWTYVRGLLGIPERAGPAEEEGGDDR